jgi:hypothetical protein
MDAPRAKQFTLIRELHGEIVVVDQEHDLAHRLTDDAVAVWRACDGVAELQQLAETTGLPESRVAAVVDRLRTLGLLDEPSSSSLQTRRSVLRAAVLVGAGLPVVTSIVLPTPAQAFDSQSSPTPTSTPTSTPAQTQFSSASSQAPAGSTPVAKTPTGLTKPPVAKHHPTPKHATHPGSTTTPAQVLGAGDTRSAARRTAPLTTRRLRRGTLPFTGSRLVQSAAAGLGLLASGVATRVALRRRQPLD